MKNLKRILFLVFLITLTAVNSFAEITEKEVLSMFVSAGMAYKDGQYQKAITKYSQIIEGGLQSGPVY
jgi:hypothetical protein